MKFVIKASIIFIAFLMSITTVMTCFKDIKILFTRESAGYLSNISDVNHISSILFLACYIGVLVFSLKNLRVGNIFILVTCFGLWLLSGRVVALKPFPDGRVITGWYYVETNKFYLCSVKDDCETIIYKDSKVTMLSFWRIRVTNKNMNKEIFFGPFTWNSCFLVFDRSINK